jgi:hypothetical protein
LHGTGRGCHPRWRNARTRPRRLPLQCRLRGNGNRAASIRPGIQARRGGSAELRRLTGTAWLKSAFTKLPRSRVLPLRRYSTACTRPVSKPRRQHPRSKSPTPSQRSAQTPPRRKQRPRRPPISRPPQPKPPHPPDEVRLCDHQRVAAHRYGRQRAGASLCAPRKDEAHQYGLRRVAAHPCVLPTRTHSLLAHARAPSNGPENKSPPGQYRSGPYSMHFQ